MLGEVWPPLTKAECGQVWTFARQIDGKQT